jgi:hypothetical protein
MKLEENRDISINLIEYIPNETGAYLKKTIIEKCPGNITIRTEEIENDIIFRKTEVNTFVQILEGKTQLEIEGNLYRFTEGSGFIIPISTSVFIKSKEKFLMVLSMLNGSHHRLNGVS